MVPLQTTEEDLNRNLTLTYLLVFFLSAADLPSPSLPVPWSRNALISSSIRVSASFMSFLLIIIAEYKPLAEDHVIESDLSQASRLSWMLVVDICLERVLSPAGAYRDGSFLGHALFGPDFLILITASLLFRHGLGLLIILGLLLVLGTLSLPSGM